MPVVIVLAALSQKGMFLGKTYLCYNSTLTEWVIGFCSHHCWLEDSLVFKSHLRGLSQLVFKAENLSSFTL